MKSLNYNKSSEIESKAHFFFVALEFPLAFVVDFTGALESWPISFYVIFEDSLIPNKIHALN